VSASDPVPELVRFATLAGNGHNTQPWTFTRSAAGIDIAPDFSRRTAVVDPDDHHLFASLGCAAENLMVAASSMSRAGSFRFDATAQRLSIALEQRAPADDALVAAIPRRQCTRSVYNGAVSTDELRRLQEAAGTEGVEVRLLTDRADIDAVRDLVVEGNRAQMADAAFVRELKQWIRFNPDAALARGDGLYSAASGNPTLPDWLGGAMFDLVFKDPAESDRYVKQINSSAGLAIFVSDANDPAHWVQAGRAYQRFALAATLLDVKHAFVNQCVEVPDVRAQLAARLGVGGKRPDLVVRFGRAPDLPFAPRRPVEQVLVG
jgi:hypothetical protein